MRNDTNSEGHHVPHPRTIAWSDDGGLTFGPAMQEPALLEPSAGCQASLVRAGRRVFYSGPLGWCRVNMTIRTWEDGAWLGPDHDILVSKGVVLSGARPRVFACACACACACFSLDLFQMILSSFKNSTFHQCPVDILYAGVPRTDIVLHVDCNVFTRADCFRGSIRTIRSRL